MNTAMNSPKEWEENSTLYDTEGDRSFWLWKKHGMFFFWTKLGDAPARLTPAYTEDKHNEKEVFKFFKEYMRVADADGDLAAYHFCEKYNFAGISQML